MSSSAQVVTDQQMQSDVHQEDANPMQSDVNQMDDNPITFVEDIEDLNHAADSKHDDASSMLAHPSASVRLESYIMEADKELSTEQAVDSIRFGKFHYQLFLVCGLGWMSDASEGAVLSFLLPVLRKEWGISTEQEGNLGSALAMGQVPLPSVYGSEADCS